MKNGESDAFPEQQWHGVNQTLRIFLTGREIDSLVYELYGLSAKEIKIVEGNHP